MHAYFSFFVCARTFRQWTVAHRRPCEGRYGVQGMLRQRYQKEVQPILESHMQSCWTLESSSSGAPKVLVFFFQPYPANCLEVVLFANHAERAATAFADFAGQCKCASASHHWARNHERADQLRAVCEELGRCIANGVAFYIWHQICSQRLRPWNMSAN